MVVRTPKITRTRIVPVTQTKKNFDVYNCLIWTKNFNKVVQSYQGTKKRSKFSCTVRVQTNKAKVCSTFAGLVPQRGTREPEKTFFKKVYRKVHIVNRMSRAINWTEQESNACSCLKRD